MRTTKEILTDLGSCYLAQVMLHMDSMNVCQSLGYNGLKRFHRCKIKEFNNYLICLENKSIDYWGIVLTNIKADESYKPSSIMNHASSMIEKLETVLKKLGELNNEFLQLHGTFAPDAQCAIKCTFKVMEKYKRIIKRYEEIGNHATAIHDLHTWDDILHKKMKEYESSLKEK